MVDAGSITHGAERANLALAAASTRIRNMEEALGAGVGLASLYVTVTVTDEHDLGAAVADVESRAEAAKVRLRRLWAGQAAGFATTLPCGSTSNSWSHSR